MTLDSYNSSFMCTYKQHDDDDLYRIQFLQAFKMDKWDDRMVREKIERLFTEIEGHLTMLIEKIQTQPSILSHMLLFLGNNPEKIDVFQCLFCADVFQETHLCITDVLNYGEINPGHRNALEKVLFNS